MRLRPLKLGSLELQIASNMKKHVRRVILDFFGIVFILMGVFGIFLPFLQGFIFLTIGFYLLSLNSQICDSFLRKFFRKHARFEYFFNKIDTFLKKILTKIGLYENEPPRNL